MPSGPLDLRPGWNREFCEEIKLVFASFAAFWKNVID
jgi:hypothetical protein